MSAPASNSGAAIAESLSDAVLTLNGARQVDGWDARATRLLGYPATEVVGRAVSVVLPDRWLDTLEEMIMAAVAGAPQAPRPVQLTHRLGHPVDVEMVVVLLPPGEHTGTTRYAAAVRDIRDRTRTEAELRQLLDLERRTVEKQSAATDLRSAMLTRLAVDDVLGRVAYHACVLLDSVVGVVSRLPEDTDEAVVQAVATLSPGLPPPVRIGHRFDLADTLVGEIAGRTTATAGDDPPGAARPDADCPSDLRSGPAAGVPILSDGRVWGALTVTREPDGRPFTPAEIDTLGELADQARLALDVDRSRTERLRLVQLEEQERLAGDLHDRIIQDLFKIGLAVEHVRSRLGVRPVTERVAGEAAAGLGQIIGRLDAAIKDLRTTIFALDTGTPAGGTGLHVRLGRLLADVTAGWEIPVRVTVDSLSGSDVSRDVTDSLLAVLRGALSDIARHSGATSVAVTARHDGTAVTLTVTDDGGGIAETGRRSGPGDMRRRAERLGGTFQLTTPAAGGTRLVWTAPAGATAEPDTLR